MMTMKEACEYVENQKKMNAIHRNNVVAQGGECGQMTDKQYKSWKMESKGASGKGRNHSHSRLWDHHNEPVKI